MVADAGNTHGAHVLSRTRVRWGVTDDNSYLRDIAQEALTPWAWTQSRRPGTAAH